MSNTVNTTITEKTIQTRLINRHDSLTNWENSNLILKPGEIALAYVETAQPKIDPETNEPLTDGRGNVISEMVPNYLMKIGVEGKTFKELSWLAAPASDVYAWAKKAEFDYEDSTKLNSLLEEYNDTLAGIGYFGSNPETDPENVLAAIKAAIDALNSATATGEVSNGEIPVAVTQTNGVVTVKTGYITNDNIATTANIAMSKVENLTSIHSTLYGEDGAINDLKADGLVFRVQDIERQLGDTGRVMEFVGTYKNTKENLSTHTAKGYFVPASDSAEAAEESTTNALKLQKGDVVAIVSGDDAGKEYIWSSTDGNTYAWEELGHAGATDKALEDFADKVLIGGLNSKRLSGEEGAPTKTLEQEFFDRTSHLEKVVGSDGYNTGEGGPGSLTSRTETIENTLTEKVPQLEEITLPDTTSASVLTINSEVLIFDCGTATARAYLNEETKSVT